MNTDDREVVGPLQNSEAAKAFRAVEEAARKVGCAAESVEQSVKKLEVAGGGIRATYALGLIDGATITGVIFAGVLLLWVILVRPYKGSPDQSCRR